MFYFQLESKKLFDIALCKCINFRKCECSDDSKVPIDRQIFLGDQRSSRRMLLNFPTASNSPKPTASSSNVRDHLENMDIDYISDITTTPSSQSIVSDMNDLSLSTPTTSGISIRSRHIEYKESVPSMYNTVKLVEVAKVVERYKVSDRKAAAIVSATLVDYRIVKAGDKTNVVDRNKIRRNIKKLREIQCQNIKFEGLDAIYFDGKIDETLKYEDGKLRRVKEEHISIVQEPNSYFIGHKTVTSKAAPVLRDSLVDFVDENNIIVNKIKAIGSDGEVTNTGAERGAIRLLEEEWHMPLQWNICMLHLNELPLRALIKHLDGATTGPTSLTGSIGKRLRDCEKLPVVTFDKINFSCSANLDVNAKNLNTDQKYLYDICSAISNGTVSEQLKNRTIGPVSHSRWTTTANRILRVYVSDAKPSSVLTTIVNYIMIVYAPAMFELKYQSSVVYGSIHFAKMVKSSRFLEENALKIVEKSLQKNAFFAHAEHIVVSMVNDEREAIRRKGWQYVLAARDKANPDEDGIRVFRVPVLNFNCNDYTDLIEMEAQLHTNPPILRDIDVRDDNIDDLASKPILSHDFGAFLKKIPLHTQAVERAVKLVSEASLKVCGEEGRNGNILNTLSSRKINPKFESKQDYNIESDENVLNYLPV